MHFIPDRVYLKCDRGIFREVVGATRVQCFGHKPDPEAQSEALAPGCAHDLAEMPLLKDSDRTVYPFDFVPGHASMVRYNHNCRSHQQRTT